MHFKTTINKDIFEHLSGVKLTDEQYKSIEADIYGRLDNFHDELMELIILWAQERYGKETE